MSLEYIRKTYQVPARRGGRIRFCPCAGINRIGFVIGARGKYLRVRFADMRRPVLLHPTWAMEYIDVEGVA